jgi:hypothetical protein
MDQVGIKPRKIAQQGEIEMKKQSIYLLFAAIIVFVVSNGSSVAAQTGSADRDRPRVVRTRTVTASVDTPLGEGQEVYYSIAAVKGYMTIDFTATATDGMNIVLGAEGSGVFESIGPLISGGNDRMTGRVRFKVPSAQRLLVNVRYAGTARYTINFSGTAVTLPGR